MSKWSLSIKINNIDYTDRLVSSVNIEREQSTAAIATFEIVAQGLGFMDLPLFVGKPVTIDYIFGRDTSRKFTGIVDVPKFNINSKTISFTCTDNLQAVVKQKYENGTIWST